MKLTNYTRLRNAQLIWHSLSATHHICLYGLKHGFGTHPFQPTWPCLIVEVLAMQVKFLIVLWSTTPSSFTQQMFLIASAAVGSICELIKHKFLNKTTLHIDLCSFKTTQRVKQCTTCQHTNYHNTTNHSKISSIISIILVSWYMCCKLRCTKISQSFFFITTKRYSFATEI